MLLVSEDDMCGLPKLDPWDITIIWFLNPKRNPMASCVPTVKQFTSLDDGQLIIQKDLPETAKCNHRCLLAKSDHEIIYEDWRSLKNGSKPQCDVTEVECRHLNTTEPFYKFLHIQTFRKTFVSCF